MGQDRVRVGVVGLGVGGGHAKMYQSLPNAVLVAICEVSEPWLKHCQEQWNVPNAFTDYREMFAMKDLDAVSIALPTFLHAPATFAALEAGKHVLVEKPMAMDAAEGEQMAAVAKKHNRVLMISFNQRFCPDSMFLKRYIQEGHMGDIYFARTLWRRPMGVLPSPMAERPTGSYNRNWLNEADKGGGVARDLGSHMIDLAMWLMGFPEVAEVHGCAYTMFGPDFVKGKNAKFDADDHTVGFVRFKNGASLQIEVSFGSYAEKETIVTELFGSKGGALRNHGQPLKLFGEVAGAYTTIEPRLSEPPTSTQTEFVNSILEGRQPLVTPEQGITVMRIIDGLRAG